MIAVSIVTYNTDIDELSHCLGCINYCKQISRVDIVDNSKNEIIREYIELNYPNVNYIPSDNIGYGAANNISIRRSLKSDNIKYHLVINSDISFTVDVVDCLISKLQQDTSIGLIMPAVIGMDSEPQSCCHPLPTPLDLFIRRFTPRWLFRRKKQRYNILPQVIGHDINVPYMHGCFMLFRLEALRKVGLFDERFFMYPEDIDITRRLHSQYKTIVTPDVIIKHLHRAASRHNLRMLYIHTVNMIRYFRKWGFLKDKQRCIFNKQLFN